MKHYIIPLALLLACSGCHSTKQGTKTEQNQAMSITGTVKDIQQGKDGYTATIETAGHKMYKATISHSNLKDPSQYRSVQTGDVITVKGSVWTMDNESHITVRELNP